MGFLHKVVVLTIIYREGIQTFEGAELLILLFESSQWRWFRHLIRMLPGCLMLEAHPTFKSPQERLKTHWRDYISHLAWEDLGVLRMNLKVLMVREMSGLPCCTLVPPRPKVR